MSTLHSTKFQLLDKEKQLRNLKAEITNRNGYPEFTMSGDWWSSSWQVYDSIVPANKDQEAIINFRKTWHLNSMNPWTPLQQKILDMYPDVKDYDERVKLLKSVNNKWKRLEFMEERRIDVLHKDIHDIKNIDIPNLLDIRTKLSDIYDGYKSNLSWTWIRTSQEVMEFLQRHNILKNIHTDDDKQNAFYIKSWRNMKLTILNPSKEIIETLTSGYHNEIEQKEKEIASLCAYYDIHEDKVYKYGHWWIKKDIKNPEVFRKTFLQLVEKAKYFKEDLLIITEENAKDYLEPYSHKRVALAVMLELNEDELSDLEEWNGNRVTHYGTEYLVGTNDEMAEEHLEDVKSFMDDLWFEGFNQSYVDTDIELDDDWDIKVSKSVTIKSEERANALNRRDGSEETCEIDGETYYAYRQ